MRWFENLNGDVPGLEAGAIVDADVAAEGLPQIDRPIDASPHDHINTIIRCNLLLEWKRERERETNPKDCGRTRRPGSARASTGSRRRKRSRKVKSPGTVVAGESSGWRRPWRKAAASAAEEAEGSGPVRASSGRKTSRGSKRSAAAWSGCSEGGTAASRGTPASGSAAAAPAPAAAAGAPPPDTAAARRCRATPSPENEGDLGGSLSRAVESRLVVVQFAG